MHFNADFIKDFFGFHLLEENQQTNDCLNQRVFCVAAFYLTFTTGAFAHCRRYADSIAKSGSGVESYPK
jgi:hypothetical protein